MLSPEIENVRGVPGRTAGAILFLEDGTLFRVLVWATTFGRDKAGRAAATLAIGRAGCLVTTTTPEGRAPLHFVMLDLSIVCGFTVIY